MANTTGIEWCDSTFNPWIGCTKVSDACDDCYAARSTPARALGVIWGPKEPRHRTSPANWKQPLQWNGKRFMQCTECGWRGERATPLIGCGACGSIELDDARRRVFCASLADVFDNQVPEEWRYELFELIAETPHLDWLLLTKRPQNIVRMVMDHGAVGGNGTRYLPNNAWLGTTTEDQTRARQNANALLQAKHELRARVAFLSVEPMLSAVDLEVPRDGPDLDQGGGARICQPWLIQSGIDWVICGGESGPKARPMHAAWAQALRDQCKRAGVPFLFKQWGEWEPTDSWHPAVRKPQVAIRLDGSQMPDDEWHDDGQRFISTGKKAAGRLLDGIEHNGFPKVATP